MLKISLLDGACRKIDDLFLCFKKFLKLGDLLGRELAKFFAIFPKKLLNFPGIASISLIVLLPIVKLLGVCFFLTFE